MKFLVIDDEHELYRVMMNDLFNQDKYDVSEIKRVRMSGFVKRLHDIHYSGRVNKFFEMPFKSVWNHWYELDKYPFDEDEEYVVLFMNGSLRNFYNSAYLKSIKKRHKNVKLCLLIFDKSIYYGARRAIKMRDCFDYVFSFDDEDCEKFGFEKFYSCFSKPDIMEMDEGKRGDAFFIGDAGGRLEILQSVFSYLALNGVNSNFYITGVKEEEKKDIACVRYNEFMSIYDEMEYSYNSNCLVEILREGQSGISLRVCEAIAFNKKLITNNGRLRELPFYDERYMRIFSKADDIDIDFVRDRIDVRYEHNDYFSPVRILDRIVEL